MTVNGRLVQPGTNSAIDDHERRIRSLERSPGGFGGELEALWWGGLPPAAVGPSGGVWTVPYVGGESVTFDLVRTYFRFESAPASGTYTVELQSSPPGGAFTPTIIDDLSLGSGVHEVEHTGSFGTIASGDLIRVDWTALGTGAQTFTIQLEGDPQ